MLSVAFLSSDTVSKPVSFLSDFGLVDEFVGVIHGVLHRLAPGSTVIDITHGIARGDVRAGALALTRAIQYLPSGVVLAVVDPEVGTNRRAIAVETEFGAFIGPDNGLLSLAVAMVGGASRIISIENPEVVIPSAGATFQGRDVFAPAAGMLASGEASIEELGPEVDPGSVRPLLLPLPSIEPTRVSGEVLWVDGYGNAETNIGPEDLALAGGQLGGLIEVRAGGAIHELPWVRAYAEVAEGEGLLHADSAGLLALAVRGGRADVVFSLSAGAGVTLSVG
jgi:hypothetical protein